MKSFFAKSVFYVMGLALYGVSFEINLLYAAGPEPWQIGFQKPSSEIMIQIYQFHNTLLLITGSIVIFVISLIFYVSYRFHYKRNPVPSKFSDNLVIEIVWTIIPIIILIFISIPSFRILRLAEKIPPSDFTIKVVGSQWYWSYSYPDHGNFYFDSYMIPDQDIEAHQKRLLEVDNKIFIPKGKVVKFIITAGDVIHSFAIPSLGIKTDAVPGRINETWTKVDQEGTYYGQCSELCGVNHGFMPIVLEVVSKEEFDLWVEKRKKDVY